MEPDTKIQTRQNWNNLNQFYDIFLTPRNSRPFLLYSGRLSFSSFYFLEYLLKSFNDFLRDISNSK